MATDDHPREVNEFMRRKFSGHDLMMVMERIGIGTGATMHVVRELELNHKRWPETIRAFTFEADDLISDVNVPYQAAFECAQAMDEAAFTAPKDSTWEEVFKLARRKIADVCGKYIVGTDKTPEPQKNYSTMTPTDPLGGPDYG